MWDRRGQGDKDRLLYWPITSSLTITCCVILKTPVSSSPASQTGVLCDCKLALTQDLTDSSWHGPSHGNLQISFHNARNFWATTWLLLVIYPCASCSDKSLIDGSITGYMQQYQVFLPYMNNLQTDLFDLNWLNQVKMEVKVYMVRLFSHLLCNYFLWGFENSCIISSLPI